MAYIWKSCCNTWMILDIRRKWDGSTPCATPRSILAAPPSCPLSTAYHLWISIHLRRRRMINISRYLRRRINLCRYLQMAAYRSAETVPSVPRTRRQLQACHQQSSLARVCSAAVLQCRQQQYAPLTKHRLDTLSQQ